MAMMKVLVTTALLALVSSASEFKITCVLAASCPKGTYQTTQGVDATTQFILLFYEISGKKESDDYATIPKMPANKRIN
jgi:hypothetical protein